MYMNISPLISYILNHILPGPYIYITLYIIYLPYSIYINIDITQYITLGPSQAPPRIVGIAASFEGPGLAARNPAPGVPRRSRRNAFKGMF